MESNKIKLSLTSEEIETAIIALIQFAQKEERRAKEYKEGTTLNHVLLDSAEAADKLVKKIALQKDLATRPKNLKKMSSK